MSHTVNGAAGDSAAARFESLLGITESIIAHRNLAELFHDLAAQLRPLVGFDFINVLLHDPARDVMRLRLLETPLADVVPTGYETPVEGTGAGWVWQTQRPLVIHDMETERRFPFTTELFRRHGINSAYAFPLTSAGRRLGTMGFGCREREGCSADSLEFLQLVVRQVAVAVDNAINFENAEHEKARAQTLLEVSNAISASLDLRDLMRATSVCLRRYFRHDFAGMALYDAVSGQLRVHALDLLQPADGYVEEGFMIPLEGSPAGLAFTSRRAVLVADLAEWDVKTPVVERALAAGIRSSCNAPLVSHDRALGSVVVACRRASAFDEADAELLTHIANQLAIAVENALQYGEIEGLKNKLASEKLYLEEEIRAEYNFAEIVGRSRALRRVLEQVETVAPTDSVVLICGETGTGKELIARAIHSAGARRERTMVKVNCAAIPTGLLESEFFGHERGAFTGAVAQRVGRFELAHKGTLFLDEVGEIPVELQPKLLRVLQEREFERLGGSRTIRVDVRLIAATNCDLPRMVAEKRFRPDLFYRLNVFPVVLPPLRERAEDIPLLAGYFAQKHALRMNKRIESIPSETVEALCRYPWPGNVRELENFVERACILTRGAELRAPLSELKTPAAANANAPDNAPPSRLLSLAEAERAHIEEVLRQTGGVVGGKGGAAEILDLPISTLRGRMKKLGLM